MVDLQCMLPTAGGRQTFYVTGLQEAIMIVDVTRGRVLREVCEWRVAKLRRWWCTQGSE